MASPALLPSLYRSVLKKVQHIDVHYKNSTDFTMRSILGIKASPAIFEQSGFGKNAVDITKLVFRSLALDFKNNEQVGLNKVFWFLRQCANALPVEATDAQYMDRYSIIEFGGSTASASRIAEFLSSARVRSVMPLNGSRFSLPRHCIPNEPFWMLQLQYGATFPLMRELLLLEGCKGVNTHFADPKKLYLPSSNSKLVDEVLKTFPIQSSTITDNVQVVCRTEYLGERDEEDSENTDSEEQPSSSSATPKKLQIYQYYITIRHLTNSPAERKGREVLLLSRHWVFYDVQNDKILEVTGSGVVGEYPCLAPGDSHTYVSGTGMKGKKGGLMRGTFQIVLLPKGGKKPIISSLLTAAEGKEETPSKEGGAVFFDVVIGPTRLPAPGECDQQ